MKVQVLRSAFWHGVGQVVDIGGVGGNPVILKRSPQKSVSEAISGDVGKIAGDMRRAIGATAKVSLLAGPRRGADRADSLAPQSRTDLVMEQRYSGPLPPPAMLRAYEDVVPGGAARIFDLMEKESDHRRSQERQELEIIRAQLRSSTVQQSLGKASAVFVAALVLGVAALAIAARG